jgi:HEPN domain-containing protein
MRWEQGRGVIEAMLASGELQKVPPSREHANQLLTQAAADLDTARDAAGSNPAGAYTLAYDAARKALVALLENEGLRPTSRAGHHGTYLAVQAQLDPPLGKVLRPFERMRRRRNELEYPNFVEAPLTIHDVEEDTRAVDAIIGLVTRVCDEMSPY